MEDAHIPSTPVKTEAEHKQRGAQDCEDVLSDTKATAGQDISEPGVAMTSQAKQAPSQELRGCLRRNWQDHLLRGIWGFRDAAREVVTSLSHETSSQF